MSSRNTAANTSHKWWHDLKKQTNKKKSRQGFFVAQPLSQRRVNMAPGQIYVGYLWSSRDEPIGLKDWTQRSV